MFSHRNDSLRFSQKRPGEVYEPRYLYLRISLKFPLRKRCRERRRRFCEVGRLVICTRYPNGDRVTLVLTISDVSASRSDSLRYFQTPPGDANQLRYQNVIFCRNILFGDVADHENVAIVS